MGLLPTTRPATANYGPTMKDDPLEVGVTEPDLETPAANWNALKDDVAFLGRVTSLCKIHVRGTDAGGFTANSYVALYGIVIGNITLARSGAGVYTCTLGGSAGFTATSPVVHPVGGTGKRTANVVITSPTVLTIYTMDNLAAFDSDFVLEVN